MPTEKEIIVSGEKALEVAEVLNATSLKILKAVRKEPLYITTIAKYLQLSEAYISDSVRTLEDLQLVSVTYQRGDRGIRKIVESALEKVTILIDPEPIQPPL